MAFISAQEPDSAVIISQPEERSKERENVYGIVFKVRNLKQSLVKPTARTESLSHTAPSESQMGNMMSS